MRGITQPCHPGLQSCGLAGAVSLEAQRIEYLRDARPLHKGAKPAHNYCPSMHFISIQVIEDNLMYLFFGGERAFSVEAYNPDAIMHALSCEFGKQRYTEREILALPRTKKPRTLLYAFTTHWHDDHSGGNARLAALSPETVFVSSGDAKPSPSIAVGPYTVTCLPTPCHTKCSLSFLVWAGPSGHADADKEGEVYSSEHYLLTGDFLFRLGCGRFFEGDSRDFLSSVGTITKHCPDSTLLLYGHDHRKRNDEFTSQFYPPAPASYFLTLGEEKEYNPFMNYRKTGVKGTDEVVVQKLREMKDAF